VLTMKRSMQSLWLCGVLGLMLGCGGTLAQGGAAKTGEYAVYVSPNGSDKASGRSREEAVRSLERVQELLRQAKPSQDQKDFAVRFLPGVYRGIEVEWNFYSPGRRVLLAPADEGPAGGERFQVVIDGTNSKQERFLTLRLKDAPASSVPTALTLRGLHIRNYCEGVSLGDFHATSDMTDNVVEGNLFTEIGSKYQAPTAKSKGKAVPEGECAAALRLQHASNGVVRKNIFRRIENLPAEETASGKYGPSLLHSIYIADHSTGNLIEDNRFEAFTGSPVRIRAESDHNRIVSNTFSSPVYAVARNDKNQIYAVSQWYCNDASEACRDKAARGKQECPSVGTEIVGNRLVGDLGVYADQSQSKRPTCVRQGLRSGEAIEPKLQGNSISK
jgi:hypothetical protein